MQVVKSPRMVVTKNGCDSLTAPQRGKDKRPWVEANTWCNQEASQANNSNPSLIPTAWTTIILGKKIIITISNLNRKWRPRPPWAAAGSNFKRGPTASTSNPPPTINNSNYSNNSSIKSWTKTAAASITTICRMRTFTCHASWKTMMTMNNLVREFILKHQHHHSHSSLRRRPPMSWSGHRQPLPTPLLWPRRSNSVPPELWGHPPDLHNHLRHPRQSRPCRLRGVWGRDRPKETVCPHPRHPHQRQSQTTIWCSSSCRMDTIPLQSQTGGLITPRLAWGSPGETLTCSRHPHLTRTILCWRLEFLWNTCRPHHPHFQRQSRQRRRPRRPRQPRPRRRHPHRLHLRLLIKWMDWESPTEMWQRT